MVNVSYFDRSFTRPGGDAGLSIKVRSYPDLDSSVVEVMGKDLSYTIALPYINPNNEDQIFNLSYSNDRNALIIVPEACGNEIITLNVNDMSYSISKFQNVKNIKIKDAIVCQDCMDGKILEISRVYVYGQFGKDESERYCEFSSIDFEDLLLGLFKRGNYSTYDYGNMLNLEIEIEVGIVSNPIWTASIGNKESITRSCNFPIMDRPEMLNLSVIVNAEQRYRWNKKYKVTVYDDCKREIMYFFVKNITPDEVNNIRAFVDQKGRRYLIFVYNNINIVIVNVDRKKICRYAIGTERSDAYKYTAIEPDNISITKIDFDSRISRIVIKAMIHFDEDDCCINVDIVPEVENCNDDIIDADMVVYFDKFAEVPVMNKINDIYCSKNFDIDVFTTGRIVGQNNTPLHIGGIVKDRYKCN